MPLVFIFFILLVLYLLHGWFTKPQNHYVLINTKKVKTKKKKNKIEPPNHYILINTERTTTSTNNDDYDPSSNQLTDEEWGKWESRQERIDEKFEEFREREGRDPSIFDILKGL